MLKQKLNGVSETLLIPLWGRAEETKRENSIIKDYKAIDIMNNIDYDFSKFDSGWKSQVGIAVRTEILDKATKKFINQNKKATIINIGCGLDTRFHRLDNGKISWYDIDLDEPMRIRKKFFNETDRYKMISKSVFDYSWIEDIEKKDSPVLIIAEGIFMYFEEREIKSIMNQLVKSFPKANMLIEVMSPAVVKMDKYHDTTAQLGVGFKWGIRTGREIENYGKGIKFIDEWNYFNYHKDRWRGIGIVTSIPILGSIFKNKVCNKIIYIKL